MRAIFLINEFFMPASTTDSLFQQLSKKTTSTQKAIWTNLIGSAQALAIAEKARLGQPIVVITADNASAANLVNELSFFYRENNAPVLHFSDWETLPYDHFSPHADLTSARLDSLHHLLQMKKGIVVASMTTVMCVLPPTEYIRKYSFVLNKDDLFDAQSFRRQLETAGYRNVDTVYSHGEFAVRGSIFDMYPMGSESPLRIELFDDSVETIRSFDPETQRGIEQVEGIRILPAREFPLDDEGIKQFRLQWHDRFENADHRNCDFYQYISDGVAPAGIEYFLPLFFEKCASLFDYLPENIHLVTTGDILGSGEHYWQEINQRYENRLGDIRHPILKPTELFLSVPDVFASFKGFSQSSIHQEKNSNTGVSFNTLPLPDISIDDHLKKPLQRLQAFIDRWQEKRVLFVAESMGRRESLIDLLKAQKIVPATIDSWRAFIEGVDQQYAIITAPLEKGCVLDDQAIAIITETELFGQQVKQRRRRKSQTDNTELMIKSLTELKIGSPVVHIDHGVGRYAGLQTIEVDRQKNEFLTLIYADDAKLYVPVTHLHLINRYSGHDESLAPHHRLGTEQWQKSKDRAAKEVRDVAAELLEIYAKRDSRKGFAFTLDSAEYKKFAAAFPFEETPDQEAAIDAVLADMQSDKPMDRLVCGDVGFGKTEVAMRATFVAIGSSKQVAVLVPTTLLAQQHYENFKDRFAEWPIEVEVVSRFKTAKQVSAIEQRLKQGKIDILIGTHKILSSDIQFNSLGLLIIDEEHRFGVRQKEAIKALRSEVDILTLTATPIPRTLNMAMHGIRDLSIIATPPARRLSVKTFVRQYDDSLIKEAVLREILRGGQVYFLHNDVKTIERTQREISELIPEAKAVVAHGQMRERELERVMSDFYHQQYNVLVCSTIIETGIDIPNANTIIIERADKFGLAQLHQLRGRVGRSHHQAYAYLLTPPPKTLSSDATKRLDAIASADDLGAGFTLATHDMEIRGAGELLGDEQSGQMMTIGFSLYMTMLDETIKNMKAGKLGKSPTLEFSHSDINLHIPALIPDDYMGDINTRLEFYKRLSGINSERGFHDLEVELIDRFGLLPNEVKWLIGVTQIKVLAEKVGISSINADARQCKLEFAANTDINPLTLVKLVQNKPQQYQLRGANQLVYIQAMHSAEERLERVEQLIKQLTEQTS